MFQLSFFDHIDLLVNCSIYLQIYKKLNFRIALYVKWLCKFFSRAIKLNCSLFLYALWFTRISLCRHRENVWALQKFIERKNISSINMIKSEFSFAHLQKGSYRRFTHIPR